MESVTVFHIDPASFLKTILFPLLLPLHSATGNNTLTEGRDDSWRKEIYYHYYEKTFGQTRHYGIRTRRYKLIHFYDPVNAWELYDLEKDPNEMSNMYNDPRYAAILSSLKQKLKTLQFQYKDEVSSH